MNGPDPEYLDSRGVETRASLYARYRPPELDYKTWVGGNLEGPAAAEVLDVGCGPGGIWTEAPAGWSVTLLDRSPGMLADARNRLADTGREFRAALGDVRDLPFPPASFDVLTAFHMVHDVEDKERALCEFRRVLVPGGTFYATTNSSRHLGEVRSLLGDLGLRGDFISSPRILNFTLEGGAKLLRRMFKDVRILRQPGVVLDVTEFEPLLAYVLSIRHVREQLTEDPLRRFREAVQAEIDTRGHFALTLDSGLIVAR